VRLQSPSLVAASASLLSRAKPGVFAEKALAALSRE
jgi:hypothetical protein